MQFAYLSMTANIVQLLEQAVLGSSQEAEVCGLLGGYLKCSERAVATAVHPLSNLSLRRHSFAVDVEEFLRERDIIVDAGLVPLALYHSHLDGSIQPSFRDRELPRITDLPLLILAWGEGKLRFEYYDEVDSKMVPISVVPCYDQEASCQLGQE